MAITVAQGESKKGIFRLISGVIVVIGLVVATYILFFTTPPQIEVFAPPEVKKITQISEKNLDPSAITNSPEYKALREHVAPPVLSEYGRENPFSRF